MIADCRILVRHHFLFLLLYTLLMKTVLRKTGLAFLLMLFFPLISFGFSVLTHEALIDASWNNAILPLLKKKFPAASEEQLKKARAYAYGGAVAPDMGYYPFG